MMASEITHTAEGVPLPKRCFLLELPAELRLAIYRAVLVKDDPDVQSAGAIPAKFQSDHTDHRSCDVAFNEHQPSVDIKSNSDSDGFQFAGLLKYTMSALLSTCRTIRREGLQESDKSVEMKAIVYSCRVKGLRQVRDGYGMYHRSSTSFEWKTFRGDTLQKLLQKSALEIQFQSGGWSSLCWDATSCDHCAAEMDIAVRRWCVLLNYLFRQVKHVTLSVLFEQPDCITNNVRRLRNVADALDDECSIETISLAIEMEPWPRYRRLDKEGWVREWKRAAYTMAKTLPPTRARIALWTAIKKTYSDITIWDRKFCNVVKILDSTGEKEPESGEWKEVRYFVKREGYAEPSWEAASEVLRKGKEAAMEFHKKYRSRARPKEIPAKVKKAARPGSVRSKISSIQPKPYSLTRDNMEDKAEPGNAEDNVVLIEAMEKLSVKPAGDGRFVDFVR